MWVQLLVVALLLAVYWVRKRYSYWKVRGVEFVEPSFPFGNLSGVGKEGHLAQVIQQSYKKLKGKASFGGLYFFINPTALILNLDLAKNVLVKDFAYFHDRSVYHNEKDDPLSGHLFALEGAKWKNLRAKLTPTFTSGKMKMMFPTITKVAEQFQDCMVLESSVNPEVEMKDLLSRFTTDVIGTCAFGLECNSLKDPQAEFRRFGRKVFEVSRFRVLKATLTAQFSQIARKLRVTLIPKDISDFFMNAVKDTIRFREDNHVHRNDFMSLLINLMKEEQMNKASSDELGKLTVEEIAAQAFVFFLAGFETSSTAMAFCLYELALNQELQDNARKDVTDMLQRHGSMSYEAVHDMTYIEMCLNESLRKYPPATTLTRVTSKDYNVPNSKYVFEKGLTVAIPVYAIQHDAEYFPDPDRYDPERFSPEQTAKRHPFAFIPFGEGPRVCIGLRFGMMQAKIGMAYLLKNFRFTLSPKTSVPLKLSPSSAVLAIDGGLWLNVKAI